MILNMKQKKIKIEARIKLSYNIYYTKGLGECAEGWEWQERRDRVHTYHSCAVSAIILQRKMQSNAY